MEECTCEFDEDICQVCPEAKCVACGRRYGHDDGCDDDTDGPPNDDWIQRTLERAAAAGRPQTTSEMMLEDLRLEGPPY